MLKQKYFLTNFFILSAEKQPIKSSWRKIEWLQHSKLINTIGASTFGVLLIHANSDTMRRWLWKDFFDNAGHYNNELFWLRPIIVCIIIFIVCIIIDYLRIRFIERKVFK